MSTTKESVVKGIFKYSISNWIGIVVGFVSVVITTRLIKPDVYGIITLFLSAANVMIYILTLGMDSACIRFYNEPLAGNTQSQLLYKNLIITSIICFSMGSACVLFLPSSVSNYIFGFSSRLIIGLLLIFTFCQIILRFLNISYRMSFNAKMYNIQNVLINCSYRVLIIAAALIRNDSLFIITILTLGLLVILLFYLYIQRSEITPRGNNGVVSFSISLKGYGEYMRYAIFNAPTYIVTYFNIFASQYIIRDVMSAFFLGVFSSTSAFTSILSVVKGGFSTFWSAYVFKEYTEENNTIIKMHDYLVVFTIVVTSLLVCCRDIVYLAIGQDYHDSKSFFSLLLIMPILSFVEETTDKGVAISKKSQIWMFTHIISALVNITLCYILVHYYGLMGAAWASAISAIILYGLNTYWGQHYYRTIKSYWKSFFGVLLLIIELIIPSLTLNIYLIIASCIVLDIIAFYLYREELSFIFNRITNEAVKLLKN